MKTRSFYAVLLAFFAIGSVLCQNAEELPIPVETDNQFPPEHSESDGHSENSETTVAESIQPSAESITTDSSALKLAEEDEQVIDKESEITAPVVDSAEINLGLTVDATSSTLTTTTENEDDADVISGTKFLEPTQTTLESTITEATSESTTSEPTIEDVAALISNDDEQVENEDSETTVAEPTQTTLDSTVVAAPAVPNDDEYVTIGEDIENKYTESTKLTSETMLDDIAVFTLTTNSDEDTTHTHSEITAMQPTELTSESPTGNDVTNNEDETTKTTSESIISDVVAPTLTTSNESPCPKPCMCITEESPSNYIVDCSGLSLTDLPTSINPKTTTLKLQNNQLTAISKAISELKNLKTLNANDNLISHLESGSISELPELVSLSLANNRLQEYPKDLENASNLDKLEELDLAGNDLKTTPEIILNFKALQKLTLPEVTSELVTQLCSKKKNLVTVCSKSCLEHSSACSDASTHHKVDSLDATLPGMIPFVLEVAKENVVGSEKIDTSETSSNLEASDIPPNPDAKQTPDIVPVPEIPSNKGAKEINNRPPELSAPDVSSNLRSKETTPLEQPPEMKAPETPSVTKDNLSVNDFSLRTAVNNAPQENIALHSAVIETSIESSNNETDVKVGAKTTETKGGGGVDKSVIAVIVAGMVIIIAVITVKKNWSSIRKRFSSTPRPNDRSGRNANGTTVAPEEVPLQDKSPV